MSIYDKLTPEELESHLSNFLISHWSVSSVNQFARNEKVFEMKYLYGMVQKMSVSSVVGRAYHTAIEYYFKKLKEGKTVGLADLEILAFNEIEEVPANEWALQKTTPTVDSCLKEATKNAAIFLRHFYAERGIIEDEIQEIIDVENSGEAFLTVSGVDIPLPCRYRIDLKIKDKKGNTGIIDHKCKRNISSETDVILSSGVQAITYTLAAEKTRNIKVDYVLFIENKLSANKDGSPQLIRFKMGMDENSRKLYELQLYEPLKRMIEAVNDPDYVYLVNPNDNLVSKPELYEFWMRTMIAEIDTLSIPEEKKELITKRIKKIRDSNTLVTPQIIKSFREKAASFINYNLNTTNMTNEQKIEHTLKTFGIIVRVSHKLAGYSSDTYLIEFSAGTKINSIYSHRLDIANALDVRNVRISKDLIPYEGKSYLGIEVSKKREKMLPFDPARITGKKIPLGEDNFGNTIIWDLENHSTPHMLVCGGTGSGKSVFLKTIIKYATNVVDEVVIMDTKRDFVGYNDIEEIEEKMRALVQEMESIIKEKRKKTTLLIFDEFADALANSKKGAELKLYEDVTEVTTRGTRTKRIHVGELKSLEENLRILAQKGRSAGFRIVIATQRASTKVITGDTKVNFPVQVCFKVQKEIDSKVVLDESGAELLTGHGDGLIKSPEYMETIRFQSFYTE